MNELRVVSVEEAALFALVIYDRVKRCASQREETCDGKSICDAGRAFKAGTV